MKRHRIDAVLVAAILLPAAAAILFSATIGERVIVILSAIVMSVPAFVVSSVFIGYRRFTRRTVLPAFLVSLVAFAILISVPATNWPLRVTYSLSGDEFDAVAQRVLAGEQIATPVRIGLFTIREARLSPQGIVCLWTDPAPNGPTGFVQTRPDHVPFNLWSIVRLDEHWQFISED